VAYTHKRPRAKTEETATFWASDICSLQIMGIGVIKMSRSVTISVTQNVVVVTGSSSQYRAISLLLVQKAEICDPHWNSSAKKKAVAHSTTITHSVADQILNFLFVANIRR
jgi:hypothetical protein